MQTGTIKNLDLNKGLGYIQENDGRELLFITKGLENKIAKGLTVHYIIRQTRRGIIAINVEPGPGDLQ